MTDKADHALEVAVELMKSDYPSDAASKTYYSMFYAAQALLKSEGEIADYDIHEEIVEPVASLKIEEGKERKGKARPF